MRVSHAKQGVRTNQNTPFYHMEVPIVGPGTWNFQLWSKHVVRGFSAFLCVSLRFSFNCDLEDGADIFELNHWQEMGRGCDSGRIDAFSRRTRWSCCVSLQARSRPVPLASMSGTLRVSIDPEAPDVENE
jgi:hypothetical protein